MMFVHGNRAVSLDGVRHFFVRRKGTCGERAVLKYVDDCEVEVPKDMGDAILSHFKVAQKEGE